MATAKKAPAKKVTKKVEAPAPGVQGKTAEVKRWAVVLEVTHTILFFFSHKHYIVEVAEGDEESARKLARASKVAAAMARGPFPNFKVKVLCVEEVTEIHKV